MEKKNEQTFTELAEVVKCKDCAYADDFGPSGIYCLHPDNRNPISCNSEDFCNCGSREIVPGIPKRDPLEEYKTKPIPVTQEDARAAAEIIKERQRLLDEERQHLVFEIDEKQKALAEIRAQQREIEKLIGIDEVF